MATHKKNISTPQQLKNEISDLIGHAYDNVHIFNLLKSSAYSLSEDVVLNQSELKQKVEDICNSSSRYARVQRIMNNKIIVPLNQRSGKWLIFDEDNYCTYTTKSETVQADFLNSRYYLDKKEELKVVYLPKTKFGIINYRGQTVFNSYKAPEWLELYLRKDIPWPVVNNVPPIYEKFLMHLCDGDLESYNYILDWMAISLQERNLTYLTTIGSAGIGKGVLGCILFDLHSRESSIEVFMDSVTSNFTSLLNDKTLVYINEVTKMNIKEYGVLKMLNGNERKSELKGVDAENVTNFANIYLSSNNLDAIKLDSDDRRFSIVNLTKNVLQKAMSTAEIEDLATPASRKPIPELAQFGFYLLNRKFDEKWKNVSFKSEQTKKIKDAAALDWERYFLQDFCKDYAGRTITVRAIIDYLSVTFKKSVVSEKTLRTLSERFEGVFKVVRTGDFEESSITNAGKPGFAPSENKVNKRLSAVRIEKLQEQKSHEIEITEE